MHQGTTLSSGDIAMVKKAYCPIPCEDVYSNCDTKCNRWNSLQKQYTEAETAIIEGIEKDLLSIDELDEHLTTILEIQDEYYDTKVFVRRQCIKTCNLCGEQ